MKNNSLTELGDLEPLKSVTKLSRLRYFLMTDVGELPHKHNSLLWFGSESRCAKFS